MIDKDDYLDSVDLLNKATYNYYSGLENIMSDDEFDETLRLVKEYEEFYPNEISDDSPTQTIGNGSFETRLDKHIKPMLSLDKVRIDHTGELASYLTKISEGKAMDWVVEPKWDGMACVLTYYGNTFVRASTRGNGEFGEDITTNVSLLTSVPKKLPDVGDKLRHVMFEIRGELVIPKNTKIDGENINTRNSVAGAVRLKNKAEFMKRNVEFIPYDIVTEDPDNLFKTHMENMAFVLDTLGFVIPVDSMWLVVNEAAVVNKANIFQNKPRSEERFNYDTDGVVIKANNLRQREILGNSNTHPNWAVAVKFPPATARTKLVAKIDQVGKTGVITPLGEVFPIEIGGVMVQYVNLHNYNFIKEKGLRMFDDVELQRSGDVIPYLVATHRPRLLDYDEFGEALAIQPPTVCPSCRSDLTTTNTGKLMCPQAEADSHGSIKTIFCEAALVERIHYALSTDCLNIKGIGTSYITHAVAELGVRNAYDLICYWPLSKGMKFQTSLARYFASLSIPGIGKVKAKKIEAVATKNKPMGISFASWVIDDPVGARETMSEKLKEVSGFSENQVEIFIKSYFDNHVPNNNAIELLALFEIKQPHIALTKRDNAFVGKNFAITGFFDRPRSAIEEFIENLGGNVMSSVSKKTDYLLCGENPGSKHAKAKELGIPIVGITEINY